MGPQNCICFVLHFEFVRQICDWLGVCHPSCPCSFKLVLNASVSGTLLCRVCSLPPRHAAGTGCWGRSLVPAAQSQPLLHHPPVISAGTPRKRTLSPVQLGKQSMPGGGGFRRKVLLTILTMGELFTPRGPDFLLPTWAVAPGSPGRWLFLW